MYCDARLAKPTIVRPRVRIPSGTSRLYFSNLNCSVKMTKINKKRSGLAHIIKLFLYQERNLSNWLTRDEQKQVRFPDSFITLIKMILKNLSLQSFSESNRFPFPAQPPYWNASHFPDSELKKNLGWMARHGPASAGSLQISASSERNLNH